MSSNTGRYRKMQPTLIRDLSRNDKIWINLTHSLKVQSTFFPIIFKLGELIEFSITLLTSL